MKLALWQTYPQADIASALTALTDAAQQAAAQGADLLVTPEMFVGGYNIGPDRVVANAGQSGDVLARLKEIAVTNGIALVVGLALPGDERPFNGCVAIDRAGQETARYHKTHLFGGLDQQQFSAGDALSPVFDLGGWRMGLAICYDIEFPEVARTLALRGADLIVVPTANMEPFDTVATRLVPARAEENAIYVAYCNYIGAERQICYNGLSCVSGPYGGDCVRSTTSPVMLFANLDRTELAQARDVQTHLSDRRPDLYGDLL